MNRVREVGQCDEPTTWLASNMRDNPLDLGGVSYARWCKFNSQCCRRGREWTDIAIRIGGSLWIEEDCYPCNTRCDVPEQLQPLSTDREFKVGETGDIGVRTRQICNQPAANRIGYDRKYDGSCAAAATNCAHRCRVMD